MNFEDERLAGPTAEHLNPLVEHYNRRHPEARGSKTVTWCFDEILVVPGCEVTYVRAPEGHEVDFLARFPDGEAAPPSVPDGVVVQPAYEWMLFRQMDEPSAR